MQRIEIMRWIEHPVSGWVVKPLPGRGVEKLQGAAVQIKCQHQQPRKYYFTEVSDSAEIDYAENKQTSPASTASGSTFSEHDLYSFLADFLWSELKIYSKRIDKKRSGNSRGAVGNKWLFPDLGGMEDLSREWHGEIKGCVQQYADRKTKLWSFEVKILINRANVCEAFFQAVSNSSWANFGYLVTSEIEGEDTLKELRMLASLHGIGLIRLDTENLSESQIMIPAQGFKGAPFGSGRAATGA